MEQGTYTNFAIDRVIYGKPAAATIAEEVERLGARRAFVMVSAPLDTETTWVAEIRSALGDRCVGIHSAMTPHTPRDAVLEAAAAARKVAPDVIVTFGGGSVVDGGKMVRLALKHDIRTLEAFDPFVIRVSPEGKRVMLAYDGADIPQISVPTTLGGGDFNPSCGCTDPRTKFKEIFIARELIPKVVILDPAVTTRTPQWLYLSTGVRALDHAVGTVCSIGAGPRSWLEAAEAIRLLSRALPRTFRDPADLEARMSGLLAMWLSMERNRFGLHMGASHGIGHVLGGTYDVPHGYTACVMLPAVMRWNASANADRQALVSEAFGQPGRPAADILAEFVAGLDLPTTLGAVGISPDQHGDIAETAFHDYTIYTNPRRIAGVEDIREILRLAS